MTILIIDKLDVRMKNITEDKERDFIVIKHWIHQEDKTIPNVYAPNNRGSKYVKQCSIEPKGKIGKYTNILWNFNTTLPIIDETSKK